MEGDMKKYLLALSAIFVLSNLAFAGSLNVDRTWVGESGDSYAEVTYINDTNSTFTNGVTIECTAFDSRDNIINVNTKSFSSHEYGSIKPGFKESIKIPVKLNGARMKSMKCSAKEY